MLIYLFPEIDDAFFLHMSVGKKFHDVPIKSTFFCQPFWNQISISSPTKEISL